MEITKIHAGDSASWVRSVPGYTPDDGYSLTYTLVNQAQTYSISASDNGDGAFLVAITAVVSALWAAGQYKLFGHIKKADERITVYVGDLILEPDIDAAFDPRSHVKKTLEALEAVIEGRASDDVMEYTIKDRQMKLMAPEELIKWHNHYQALYRQELAEQDLKNGITKNKRMLVRFR